MASLTEVAHYTRRGVVFGVLGIFALFILKFALDFGISYWKAENPPLPPKPTVAFGKLPKIKFPENKTYPKTFELQTIEGRPPESSPSAKVFFIPQKAPSLFSRKKAEEFAQKFGFNSPPRELNSTLYQFVDEATGNILNLDITNYNFSYKVNYLDSSIFEGQGLLNKEEAVSFAQKYFTSLGVFDQSLKKEGVSYLKFEGQKLVPTTSLADAQAVRVDFLKDNLEGLPILPLEYDKSSVYLIFSGSAEKTKQVLESSFFHFPPDPNAYATYPLIFAKEAWEKLKEKKGYIVRLQDKEEKVIVRKIYLAYLETPEYQPYLQPIFVFEGDKDFVAYVSAIDPLWIED